VAGSTIARLERVFWKSKLSSNGTSRKVMSERTLSAGFVEICVAPLGSSSFDL
jgi:hypothetical protein